MQKILAQTRTCVIEAGEIILEHWPQSGEVRHKGRIDLVTDTDLAVEEKLKQGLKNILPQSHFLAEESNPEQKL